MLPTKKLLLFMMTLPVVYSDLVTHSYNICGDSISCPNGITCTRYAPCSKGICNQCASSDYKSTFDTTNTFVCMKASYKIGDNGCIYNTDCYDDKSFCDTSKSPNVCKCPTGFQASSDSKSCVSQGTVKLGASCSNNYQCGRNALCSASRLCQCSVNYKTKSDSLSDCEQYKPGDTCTQADCTAVSNCPGATCTSGTYQCLNGYTWVSQIQIAMVDGIISLGACVLKTASMNVGAGKSCTLLWPYTEICASGLMCTQCGENAYNVGTCVNSPTSGSESIKMYTYFASVAAMVSITIYVFGAIF